MYTKVASVSPTGRIRKTTAYKQSTQSRINEIVRELGIDANAYKFSANIRKYTRLTNNQYLFTY